MTTRQILITPAPDCPAAVATPPTSKARPARANIEFELLTKAPYSLDHKAFSHAVHVAMAKVSGKPAQDFENFHAKGQPCMRASPLTKRYGWAAHYDSEGKLALVDPGSAEFRRLSADAHLPSKPAMRAKRA